MLLSEFDFNLPADLIARFPAEKRENSRLMIVDRKSKEISHDIFSNLNKYLDADDFFVFNSSRVLNARIFGKVKDKPVDCLVLRFISANEAEVFLKPARRAPVGSVIRFEEGIEAQVVGIKDLNKRLVVFNCEQQQIYRIGYAPLPPYIKRKFAEAREWRDFDLQRYQTVYAENGKSIAAPTAGLHFSRELLQSITKNHNCFFIRLHVGEATFQKISVSDIENHKILTEEVEIDFNNWKKISDLKKQNARLLAVGTTTVRALESAVRLGNFQEKFQTGLYIYPPFEFKMVDKVITNFHLPRSSLFIMISAFCGLDLLKKAYQTAIDNRYRFYSYGDCMLIK